MLPIVRHLTEGRDEFLDAVASAHEYGNASAGGWSVLECVEHVVLSETGSLRRLEEGRQIPTFRDPEKETGLFSVVRSRLDKVDAPAPVRPQGRFADLDAALRVFVKIRERVIRLASTGEELYRVEADHPYFGPLNGVEWMQVIDAHARRHAEQIQEIVDQARAAVGGPIEKPSAKPKRPDRKPRPAGPKLPAFRRDVPDLAADLPECDPEELEAARDVLELEECKLRGFALEAGKLARMALEGVVLEGIEFSGCEIGSAVWKDVRLVGCDLANVLMHRLTWVRVELIDCRLTGFTARDAEWQDVLVRGRGSAVRATGGREVPQLRVRGRQSRRSRFPGGGSGGMQAAQLRAGSRGSHWGAAGEDRSQGLVGRRDVARGARPEGSDCRSGAGDGLCAAVGD